jgi:CRP-like cAMP-binding protein
MINTHLKKLRLRSEISAEEERVIRDLVADIRRVPADRMVVRAGEELKQCLLLLDGWLARAKDLPTGERQVTELHVAGDFADLHGFTLKRLEHDVVSMSECTLAVVPHERVRDLTEKHPHLTRVYWLSTNIDAAISREMALSLGQRSAISRMAHLFCELHVRLQVVGKAAEDGFEFPLTQRELSECLGLTVVHVNRTLQEIRRMGVVQAEHRHIRILDRKQLETIAEFDPAYLQLHRRKL